MKTFGKVVRFFVLQAEHQFTQPFRLFAPLMLYVNLSQNRSMTHQAVMRVEHGLGVRGRRIPAGIYIYV
jgi:hypothetical protein